MGLVVFSDGLLIVNSVDLSDHLVSATLNYSAAALDATAMGVSTHIAKGGIFDWSIDAMFHQDFAASSINATHFGLVGAAAFPMDLRVVKTGGRSATNPSFVGNAVLLTYVPVSGKV